MGWMREFLGEGVEAFDDRRFELPPGTCLSALVETLGFDTDTQYMVMCNGQRILPDLLAVTALQDGDEVLFVPPLKGG